MEQEKSSIMGELKFHEDKQKPKLFHQLKKLNLKKPETVELLNSLSKQPKYLLVSIFITLALFLVLLIFIAMKLNKPTPSGIFNFISPVPLSQVISPIQFNILVITDENPKTLRAVLKVGESNTQNLKIDQVGKNQISLTGTWDPKVGPGPQMVEVFLYNTATTPTLIGYNRLPITIIAR